MTLESFYLKFNFFKTLQIINWVNITYSVKFIKESKQ